MKYSFWHSVWISLAILLLLIGVDLVASYSGLGGDAGQDPLRWGFATIRSRELNREAREQQTAGYYEGLLNEGSRVSPMNSLLVAGVRAANTPQSQFAGVRRRRRLSDRYEQRGDFLYYHARPNVNVPDYDDADLRLVTNSHGLADREYSVEKPAGTRRIALFGDSVSRGMGAPFQTSYEALFEQYLNEAQGSGEVKFEVLNFSVSGYRITQMFDVALETAPAFDPDVYVFALTELVGSRRWGEHFAQVAIEGIDLKYDFLKEAAARVRLQAGDPPGTVAAKLSPARLPILRQILAVTKDHAARAGATLVVLLVPNVRTAEAIEEDFEGIRPLIQELQIPLVDLSDTFNRVTDFDAFRVNGENSHPNQRGHQLIFERLRDRFVADERFRHLVIGN